MAVRTAAALGSPYATHERYADGRRRTGVKIPRNVEKVVVEGRDKSNGYGGKTKEVELS